MQATANPDSGYPNSGRPDSGRPDSGCPDSGCPDSGPLPRLLGQALRRHALLIALVAGYAVVAIALGLAYPTPAHSEALASLARDFVKLLPAMAYFALMARWLALRRAGRGGLATLRADLAARIADRNRLVNGGLAVLLMLAVLMSFAQLKKLIPVLQPFQWDDALARADAALHFGWQPWELAHAAFGHPLILTAVTGAYNFWMFLMYFMLLLACFGPPQSAARMRYLLAFVLCWALAGSLMATVFSSAGPVYVQRLGLGDQFAPLMALLQDHAARQPISVLETQDALWAWYAAPDSLNGISAFPSMHVASSVLMACHGYRLHRLAGHALAGFAGVILLGSVLLGWHYAVDGYAGALVALAAWALAGRLVRRFGPAGA